MSDAQNDDVDPRLTEALRLAEESDAAHREAFDTAHVIFRANTSVAARGPNRNNVAQLVEGCKDLSDQAPKARQSLMDFIKTGSEIVNFGQIPETAVNAFPLQRLGIELNLAKGALQYAEGGAIKSAEKICDSTDNGRSLVPGMVTSPGLKVPGRDI